MDTMRFRNQMTFLVEIDRMKTVLRRNLIADGSKREDDAEHSWHLAMMAMVLKEYAAEKEHINFDRVLRMALVHDLVEVYAGDTFCYDQEGNQSKAQREQEAADRLFDILPSEQGAEYRKLWEEFDAMDTPDSRYAAAIDRLQPFVLNYLTNGHTWKLGNVESAQVYQRIGPVKEALPELWEPIVKMIQESIEKGLIRP